MPVYFTSGEDLGNVADAIRTKLASTLSLEYPNGFVSAINDIITPTGTINITQNGTVDVTQYASADVAVPNTYAAADEGKVVSNGALVAQGSDTVTANDTYDTTLINSLTVNVSGGVTPTGTKQINVTANGTTTTDVTAYATAEVIANVPNTYSSGDEGKVVYNGALVAQTSGSVNTDGTYDTTLINSMTVSTGGGGSSYATRTVTPDSRTNSITFDTGLSTIHFLAVVPTSESPLKGNGRTAVAFFAINPGTTFFQWVRLNSNSGGTGMLSPGFNSSSNFSQSGTSVTITTDANVFYETVSYTWYAY